MSHYIALYVDDLLMIGPSIEEIERILRGLESRYGIKRLGPAEYVLGIQLIRGNDNSLAISQEAYLKEVLARFGMSDCKPATTPMAQSLQLEYGIADTNKQTKTKYLQAIGSLMYASPGTRPDLSQAVSYLSRFSAKPTQAHWTAIKQVLRYIKGALKLGLKYCKTSDSIIGFSGYSDSDWGACQISSRSTMGFCFQLAGASVSWSSKLQTRVADS